MEVEVCVFSYTLPFIQSWCWFSEDIIFCWWLFSSIPFCLECRAVTVLLLGTICSWRPRLFCFCSCSCSGICYIWVIQVINFCCSFSSVALHCHLVCILLFLLTFWLCVHLVLDLCRQAGNFMNVQDRATRTLYHFHSTTYTCSTGTFVFDDRWAYLAGSLTGWPGWSYRGIWLRLPLQLVILTYSHYSGLLVRALQWLLTHFWHGWVAVKWEQSSGRAEPSQESLWWGGLRASYFLCDRRCISVSYLGWKATVAERPVLTWPMRGYSVVHLHSEACWFDGDSGSSVCWPAMLLCMTIQYLWWKSCLSTFLIIQWWWYTVVFCCSDTVGLMLFWCLMGWLWHNAIWNTSLGCACGSLEVVEALMCLLERLCSD